jgi:hypothetical protein
MAKENKVCPECGHEFQGNGWDGIDAHWRANHAHVMRYEEAWPLISAGTYKPKRKPREDVNQAAARIVREATEKLG